ncbi:MAG TPA: GNAT family N-acetyltransferase [Clostridiales bacterium]|jgi:predicted N-acetyltransferase YhbS|nr:GNAT family N-acetyltransferase [Clostridiales bacterium]
MPDMLVRLWKLDFNSARQKESEVAEREKVKFVRPLSPNFKKVEEYIEKEFGKGWASEATAALYNDPVSCFISIDEEDNILGFACYDATGKGFFGPTGVSEKARGKGIGSVLLWRCLEGLWDAGYAYGIIGAAGPMDYYAKTVGATIIEDSSPGIYYRCF